MATELSPQAHPVLNALGSARLLFFVQCCGLFPECSLRTKGPAYAVVMGENAHWPDDCRAPTYAPGHYLGLQILTGALISSEGKGHLIIRGGRAYK